MLRRAGYGGHPDAQAIPLPGRSIRRSGCAFAAPSANLSGRPSPTNAQDVLADMDGRLPLILDGGECAVGVESTVVSVVGPKPTLFRPGHITLEDLERALGEEVEVSAAILEKLPEGAVVRSPGMKYKHYAPKADITILDGSFEQFRAYVQAHADQNPSCLCFTGEASQLGVPCVEYGREGDGADQAKHLFRSLRALDEQGDGVVYARCPGRDGLSMAVYNRLVRAAAFRVVPVLIDPGHYGPQRLRQIYCHAGLCPAGCPAGGCDRYPGRSWHRVRRCCRSWHSALDRTWWTRRDGWTAAPWQTGRLPPRKAKRDLDALTHPEIIRRIRQAKQEAQAAGCKLFVLDGAVIRGHCCPGRM